MFFETLRSFCLKDFQNYHGGGGREGGREGERESERDRRGREKNDEHDDDIVDEGCITIK
jgi:hypothetical protein